MNNKQQKAPFEIRGIPLYGFNSMSDFVDFLFLPQLKSGMLVAINAEKVLAAESNPQVQQLLTQTDFNYPDGISIVRAIRKKYPATKINRIAGADLWEALMARAGQEQCPVFLVGGKAEILQQTATKLTQQWQVPLVGQQDGYFKAEQEAALIARIQQSGAKIVTVAMGSPRQELFIQRCKALYPEALYMGVGGTYDVFTGHVKRAPKLWQDWGLEWLYRLIRQPSRLKRQFKLLRFQKYYWRGDL